MAGDNDRMKKMTQLNGRGIKTVVSERKQSLLTNDYFELKTKIHDRLLDLIDLSLIDSLEQEILRREIRKLVERILQGS
jgi:pilus assembly protein CpaF